MNSLKNHSDYIFVGLILIIAIILRIVAINNYGALTIDEPYSWRFAHYDSVLEVIKKVITIDVHMPLYFVYLHYWIKIVGDTPELLHYSSLFLFLPTIPLAFYFAKKHFNKLTAYFLIILLASNTFCIYYSIFIRFYSVLMLFGLLLSYFLIEVCEKFDKKSIIGFVITHTLFFYTYNLEIVYAFFCCLVGLFYIYKHKKEKIKDFIKICLWILLISIPGIILMINNTILLHNSICSYVKEFYHWDVRVIYDFFENLFTFENLQITKNDFRIFKTFLTFIHKPIYAVFVLLPFLIAVFVSIKTLFQKNKFVIQMAAPTILTIILILILSRLELIYFQSKYLIFLLIPILSILAYGFSRFKYIENSLVFFTLYFLLNIAYLLSSEINVLKFNFVAPTSMQSVFRANNIKDKDLILSLFAPESTKYYHKIGQIIPFSMNEALFLKDKRSLEFYFGKDNITKINKENILNFLEYSLLNDIPQKEYEENLVKNYFSKMFKGQKLVIINQFEIGTGECEFNPNYTTEYLKNLKDGDTFFIIIKKTIRDSILIANKHLKHINTLKNPKEGVAIYIYEKE